MNAADSGLMDRSLDEGTDSQSAVDNGTIDATEIDAGDLTDSGTNDGGAVQDARFDMGSISNGSAGCGAAQSPVSGAYEMDVNGTVREYHIVLPDGYDSSRTHKLIFVWHGLGGSAEREVNRGFFGLLDQSDGSAIFVAGQGLSRSSVLNPDESGRSGWLNRDGNDVTFARALLAKMRADFCIDDDRVFNRLELWWNYDESSWLRTQRRATCHRTGDGAGTRGMESNGLFKTSRGSGMRRWSSRRLA